MKTPHPDSMTGRLKPQLGQVMSNPMARAFAPSEEQLVREMIRKVLKEDTYNPYSPNRVSKPKIVDYSKSTNKMQPYPSLINIMKERWQTIQKRDTIYYFDKGHHFATLMNIGNTTPILYHDGTVNRYGLRTKE